MITPTETTAESLFPAPPRSAVDRERVVHAAEPRTFFVEPRVMRRVIKHHLLSHLGLHVPQRNGYVVDRAALFEAAARDELSPADVAVPATVFLLTRLAEETSRELGPEAALIEYWRRSFRCRAENTVNERWQSGQITPELLRERIDHLGQTEYDEVRSVLLNDDLVLPPRTEAAIYTVFVARFWELRYFDPGRIAEYFPALRDLAAVEAVLSADIDAAACFNETRPEGAPDPATVADLLDQPPAPVLETTGEDEPRDDRRFRAFLQRAEQASEKGNLVRAAVLRSRAARLTSRKRGAQTQNEARRDLERLAHRLQVALQLNQDDAQRLGAALRTLLERCPHNIWTAELRLLYDLQSVCVDLERDIYAVEPVETVLSLGRRPMRRKVDAPKLVLAYRHLHRASKRVAVVRVTPQNRASLTNLFEVARHHLEHAIRHELRPRIHLALDGLGMPAGPSPFAKGVGAVLRWIAWPVLWLLGRFGHRKTRGQPIDAHAQASLANERRVKPGLIPHNLPERVARDKLVEELLDRIIERGHAKFGDVRDAVSRSGIKLDDLGGPGDVLGRDALLRIDRNLSYTIDGVYRRAEIYLRFFQKISALLFATIIGRLLTRYVLLPFGGAFMLVEFATHVAEAIAGWFWVPEAHIAAFEPVGGLIGAGGATGAANRVHLEFGQPYTFLITGFIFLGLLHSRWLRRQVGRFFRGLGTAIAWLWRQTVQFLGRPLMQAIFTSRPALFVRRYVFKPAILGLLTAAVLSAAGVHVHESLQGGLIIFLVMNVALNTRLGRDVEEITNEWLVRGWREFRTRVLAGMLRAIMDFFRAAVEGVDRFLYSVDEWLRFRSGESQRSLVFKAVAGSVWWLVTYVVRFSIILLVEPQVNPIKHFPVVTVSHKLLLPTIPAFAGLLEKLGYDAAFSYTLATLVIFSIPGIFGFLAWELKENWRLYEANRPTHLQTAVIGHHGENVLGFLKPGIHSGTLPKLYRKLRRAEQSRSARRRIAARKYKLHIEEARHALQHYFERELLALLHLSRRWPHPLQMGEVALSSNSMRVEIACPALQGVDGEVAVDDPSALGRKQPDCGPLALRYDEQSGWLLAKVAAEGWLTHLTSEQRELLRNAVIGLHHRSGVDLVHEQLLASFGRGHLSYDVSNEGLKLWEPGMTQAAIVYNLDAPLLEPLRADGSRPSGDWPKLPPAQLLYKDNPVAWREWVATWETAEQTAPPVRRLLPKIRVLPPATRT